MDNMLCDELLQEIFMKLPPSSSSSVSLVSKRWLSLFRSSRTSLSLRLLPPFPGVASLCSLLSDHSSLSSLSLFLSSDSAATAASTDSAVSDYILAAVSSCCPRLRALRFMSGPVSLSSLNSLSTACTRLTSLCINLPRPISLRWVLSFPSLRELAITWSSGGQEIDPSNQLEVWESDEIGTELGLQSLCLVGIRRDDWGVGWLWSSCKKLKKLRLQSCQGIGGPYSSFVQCLQNLEEVELRTCRSVIDGVLFHLAENCQFLNSLLVYDGGSRDGLLYFFSHCRSNLQKLDLRLPLDLNNDHLSAMASKLRGLLSLRLQNCCLVTGEGLKLLGTSGASSGLEELALINCDVVERESGLLATLGQHLRQLRKLDLSHNELLLDKEFISMSVSCTHLSDLKLRGCKGLTNAAIVAVLRSCKFLENVDIMHCGGIESEAIEVFVEKCPKLRRINVEENKLSDEAKTWASNRFIEVVV
ncbi:F-box/LRR-repeat protein 4-like [Neltuma alba]|uniref:F-box/LRR-repeat protein 4-like n=1 Tax=Neltuma alba TaxID=207710 RepID=UPI0010A53F7C|nr:F-box/LRR-repeat protein 4-like [Prosopis alba]